MVTNNNAPQRRLKIFQLVNAAEHRPRRKQSELRHPSLVEAEKVNAIYRDIFLWVSYCFQDDKGDL
jgi:hypothetical protein